MKSLCFELGLLFVFVTIAEALVFTGSFSAKVIQSTWRPTDSELLGTFSRIGCAEKIVTSQYNCYAFHLTSDKKCYVVKENRNWIEQRPLQTLTFWVKVGAPAFQCSTSVFPISFGKSRYLFEKTNKKYWMDAAKHCESLGSKLAQISTDAEWTFLWKMVNTPVNNTGRVYVGGYKDPNDGLPHDQGWRWRGSEESLNPSFWSWGNPDNYMNEQYYSGFWHHTKGLDDTPASELQKFICECLTL